MLEKLIRAPQLKSVSDAARNIAVAKSSIEQSSGAQARRTTVSSLFVFLGTASLAGCAPKDVVETGEREPSIFYASQEEANAALEAYGRRHPECKLWTNWQKMCSRTGLQHSVNCTVEPDNPVPPSEPFCAATSHGIDIKTYNSEPMKASAARFCKGELYGSMQLSCSAPAESRPFGGYSISSRRHPYCQVWAEEHTGNPVCAEGNAFPELPRCEVLSDTVFRSKNVLYCAQESALIGNSCSDPGGLASYRIGYWTPEYPRVAPAPENVILPKIQIPPYILSVYCKD